MAGVAFIALFIMWSNNTVQFGKFIGQVDAINIVKEKYPSLRSEILQPRFGYLEYSGIGTGVYGNPERQFDWHAAEPTSGKVGELLHPKIGFGSAGAEIRNQTYVWTVGYWIPASDHIIFVDAETGEIIGEWLSCPLCICYHNGVNYK